MLNLHPLVHHPAIIKLVWVVDPRSWSFGSFNRTWIESMLAVNQQIRLVRIQRLRCIHQRFLIVHIRSLILCKYLELMQHQQVDD